MGDVNDTWTALLAVFFGPANKLDWPSAQPHPVLTELMRLNEQLLLRDPPGPVILPAVDLNGNTTYYAVAGDDEQARHLSEVVGAFIGPTCTTYTGRSLHPEAYDQVQGAVVRFAGSPARVFHFDVAASERKRVQAQVRRLLATWTSRPKRTLGDIVPIGRLLDDFDDALERGDEDRAKQLLYEELLHQGRLSGPNRIFLEARYLAAFEHWNVFDNLPDLADLLRLRRPALVSDALARLALHHLADVDDDGRLAAFIEKVAARYGALVPSLDVVRSPAGAAYHVLWSLHAGESGAAVATRLTGTPWATDPLVAAVLAATPEPPPDPGTGGGLTDPTGAIEDALASGLYDRAIELLEEAPAALGLVAVVGRILRETLSLRAGELLRRYRLELGDQAVQHELDQVAAVTALPAVADDPTPDPELPEPLTWPEAFRRLAAGELSAREADLEEKGLVELLRGDDLAGVVSALDAVGNNDPGPAIDEGLALCRRLEAAGADPDLLSPLRRKLVEIWALGDSSGQRRRAEVMVEQLEKLLRQGVGTAIYSELVEQVTLAWKPFLNDQSVKFSLDTLEFLAGFQPADDNRLDVLASAVLNRIGPHNASRIEPSELLVAAALAREFDLRPDFGDALVAGCPAETTIRPLPPSFVIGLYSLDESVLQRTADVLRHEHPGVTVETNSDKVSTEALKAMVRRADVLVVAELSSKHAATNTVKATRYPRTYGHAAGKGSSSLLRAVDEEIRVWLEDLAA